MTKAVREQSKVIKGYDAVAEVRKVRDQLAEEMQGMTADEKIAFIEAKAAKVRQQLPSKEKNH